MKRLFLLLSVVFLLFCMSDAQVRVSTAYNYPLISGSPTDSVLNGLSSIRGVWVDDLDGNGKADILVSNYNDFGHVHVFEAVGNDSIRLVWTSPRVATGGANSTPRMPIVGDLDNDGKKEIIFLSNNNGVFIFEWDGVVGSHNYGTVPSQLIGAPFIASTATIGTEYLEAVDVDGDGQQELLIPANPTGIPNDKYYVIRGEGDWSTGDPGFSSFTVEYEGTRTNLGSWGLSNGGPQSMISANFDGTGNREILIQAWDAKTITPMRVPAANTYQLADTATRKAFVKLGGPVDDVALFGGIAYDIDNDGRQEVYLPTYPGTDGTGGRPHAGWIQMISYNTGESTAIIDSAVNVTLFDLSPLVGTGDLFGYGYGDIDGNGKKNLYFSSGYGKNVVTMEFQGGNKRNPANWTSRILYPGDSTILESITYRDSLGRRDTLRSRNVAFPAKIFGRNTDIDGDGREDIVLPFQALNDSVTTYRLTWNAGLTKYDTVKTKAPNPKRWGLRVIERDPTQGIDIKDLTIITPDDYRLEQNYPNPFNPTTSISFFLPIRDRISLKVYDLVGREVRTLVNNEEYQPGTSTVVWNGKDNRGNTVASGTYFYTLKFGNFEKTNKLMVLK